MAIPAAETVLQGLNEAQARAVQVTQGPLLILAGPGSGKTRVITYRIAYLVKVCGVWPSRIMALTFTNKAAREMKARLERLLPGANQGLTVGTFHATCAQVLRRDGQAAGIPRDFAIYDDGDQMQVMKRALGDLDLDSKRYAPRNILSTLSHAKSELLGPEAFAQQAGSYYEEIVARCYARYQELLDQARALDFDDLLLKAVELWRGQPEVLKKYQDRYNHLLVDEFQDTNVAQYVFARTLASLSRNICVVGDPDQSIYSWRSADIRNILNFERDYPDATVIALEQNYRSTQTILEAASAVIAPNTQRKEVRLWTENSRGLAIKIVEAADEREEARLALEEAERLVQAGRPRREIAFMYRTNAQSRALEEACVRYGVPYHLVGATRFYERREIKDILCYLRLIHNPYDDVSLARVLNVPSRGIGQRTADELEGFAQRRGVPLYTALQLLAGGEDDSAPPDVAAGPPAGTPSRRSLQLLSGFLSLLHSLMEEAQALDPPALLERVIERTGYRDYTLEQPDGEERLENIQELRTVASEFTAGDPAEALVSFLEQVALVSDADDTEPDRDALTLITLHQAKGLEFPVVFITGLEEGVLPHRRSFDDPAQMEEERRLCYVGITRAKERLYLLRARHRASGGPSGPNPPSRFLADIPERLLAGARQPVASHPGRPWTWGAARAGPGAPSQGAPSQVAPAFAVGARVRHPTFGEGVVVKCEPAAGDQLVTVAFKGQASTKKLLLSLAKLERVE
ncbi:MAG: AAA family ATPase [Dehalococcoidia bacterium]|nr:AAA family ATPase [Dehalococcoidia bacterium]